MTVIRNKLSGPQNQPNEVILPLALKEKDDHFIVTFEDGEIFGTMRETPSGTLKRVLNEKVLHLKFEPIVSKMDLTNILERATKAADAITRIDINLYGPPESGERLGKALSDAKMWIQRPDHRKRNLEYRNPHMLEFPHLKDIGIPQDAVREPRQERSHEDRLRQTLNQVEGAAQRRAAALERVEGDHRLKTPLLKYEFLGLLLFSDNSSQLALRTSMLTDRTSHQQQGLGYMLQRESGEAPDEFRLWEPTVVDGENMYARCLFLFGYGQDH